MRDLIPLFFIALAIVSPYGIVLFRRSRAVRAVEQAASAAHPDPDSPLHPDVESQRPPSVDDDDLSPAFSRIADDADRLRSDPAASFEVRLSDQSHVDGTRVGRSIAVGLLGDAAQRSGVALTLMSDHDAEPASERSHGVDRVWIGLNPPST